MPSVQFVAVWRFSYHTVHLSNQFGPRQWRVYVRGGVCAWHAWLRRPMHALSGWVLVSRAEHCARLHGQCSVACGVIQGRKLLAVRWWMAEEWNSVVPPMSSWIRLPESDIGGPLSCWILRPCTRDELRHLRCEQLLASQRLHRLHAVRCKFHLDNGSERRSSLCVQCRILQAWDDKDLCHLPCWFGLPKQSHPTVSGRKDQRPWPVHVRRLLAGDVSTSDWGFTVSVVPGWFAGGCCLAADRAECANHKSLAEDRLCGKAFYHADLYGIHYGPSGRSTPTRAPVQ
jgi:hypothetical protein